MNRRRCHWCSHPIRRCLSQFRGRLILQLSHRCRVTRHLIHMIQLHSLQCQRNKRCRWGQCMGILIEAFLRMSCLNSCLLRIRFPRRRTKSTGLRCSCDQRPLKQMRKLSLRRHKSHKMMNHHQMMNQMMKNHLRKMMMKRASFQRDCQLQQMQMMSSLMSLMMDCMSYRRRNRRCLSLRKMNQLRR